MKDKELLSLFLRNGWVEVRCKGSHHIIEKGGKRETIPVHNRDTPKGLLNMLLKRHGLDKEVGQ